MLKTIVVVGKVNDMINQEFENKFQNHLLKVNGYTEDDLSGLFDKFRSLYVCYNMLFSTLPDILRQNGVKLVGNDTDKKKATEYVHRYLSGQDIMEAFSQNNKEDLEGLDKILRADVFNINLNAKSEPQKDKDLMLLAEIQSGNNDLKTLGVLKTIYQVRCNEVHGSKDFVENQRLLLEPLTHLLETLVRLLHNKLSS